MYFIPVIFFSFSCEISDTFLYVLSKFNLESILILDFILTTEIITSPFLDKFLKSSIFKLGKELFCFRINNGYFFSEKISGCVIIHKITVI